MPMPNQRVVNNNGTTTIRVTRLRQRLLETGAPNYVTAAKAEIHPYTLSQYTQGKKDISVKHLNKLVEVLGVPPEAIIGWDTFIIKTPHIANPIEVEEP